jgi:hypothetical protein
MSKVEARLDRVCCEMHVTGAPETERAGTVIVVPERVQWEAWLLLPDGQFYAVVMVFGSGIEGERRNATFFPEFDDIPSWIPAPPAWYVDAVAELRAAGEDLSKGVSR